MSHVTDVKLKVRDLNALQEAAEACGLELRRDQKSHAWWGRFVGDSHSYGEVTPDRMGKCEHALRIPGTSPVTGTSGPWEIGVYAAKDGDGYAIAFDTFGSAGRALLDKVGPNADRLRQEYAVAVATRRARALLSRKGFTATRVNEGGRIRIRLRKR